MVATNLVTKTAVTLRYALDQVFVPLREPECLHQVILQRVAIQHTKFSAKVFRFLTGVTSARYGSRNRLRWKLGATRKASRFRFLYLIHVNKSLRSYELSTVRGAELNSTATSRAGTCC